MNCPPSFHALKGHCEGMVLKVVRERKTCDDRDPQPFFHYGWIALTGRLRVWVSRSEGVALGYYRSTFQAV